MVLGADVWNRGPRELVVMPQWRVRMNRLMLMLAGVLVFVLAVLAVATILGQMLLGL
jgi:hypothetical protein